MYTFKTLPSPYVAGFSLLFQGQLVSRATSFLQSGPRTRLQLSHMHAASLAGQATFPDSLA